MRSDGPLASRGEPAVTLCAAPGHHSWLSGWGDTWGDALELGTARPLRHE